MAIMLIQMMTMMDMQMLTTPSHLMLSSGPIMTTMVSVIMKIQMMTTMG